MSQRVRKAWTKSLSAWAVMCGHFMCMPGWAKRSILHQKKGEKNSHKLKCVFTSVFTLYFCASWRVSVYTNVLFCYSGSYLFLQMDVKHTRERKPCRERESHVLIKSFVIDTDSKFVRITWRISQASVNASPCVMLVDFCPMFREISWNTDVGINDLNLT